MVSDSVYDPLPFYLIYAVGCALAFALTTMIAISIMRSDIVYNRVDVRKVRG